MNKLTVALGALGLVVSLAACSSSADVASANISTDADYFKVERKITFYNGITGQDMLVITGLCSRGNNDKDKEVTITCKTGDNTYVKDFLGLSDNVTYMIEQIAPDQADPYHYSVVWRPETVIPNISVK